MDKKFELTNETIVFRTRTLYRIKALKDFETIKAGDLGGFIEKESNLSQEGNCWIFENARIFGNAEIFNNAEVYDEAVVCDNAVICDNAIVFDNAEVYGQAKICGNAIIKEQQTVFIGVCTVDLSKNLKESIRCQTNLIP